MYLVNLLTYCNNTNHITLYRATFLHMVFVFSCNLQFNFISLLWDVSVFCNPASVIILLGTSLCIPLFSDM